MAVLAAVAVKPVKEAGLVVEARSRCVLRAGTASRPCGGRPRGFEAAVVPASEAGAAEETAGAVWVDAAAAEAGPGAVAVATVVAGCEIVAELAAP